MDRAVRHRDRNNRVPLGVEGVRTHPLDSGVSAASHRQCETCRAHESPDEKCTGCVGRARLSERFRVVSATGRPVVSESDGELRLGGGRVVASHLGRAIDGNRYRVFLVSVRSDVTLENPAGQIIASTVVFTVHDIDSDDSFLGAVKIRKPRLIPNLWVWIEVYVWWPLGLVAVNGVIRDRMSRSGDGETQQPRHHCCG